jgi:hypothetical protein
MGFVGDDVVLFPVEDEDERDAGRLYRIGRGLMV